MRYRRFGRTGLQMPVFSCGGMRYQQSWNDIRPDEVPRKNQENIEAVIHRSLELGINHIETARGYGSSEMQLGWILPKLNRDQLIIQTKVMPQADPLEFKKILDRSLELLGVEHVDLLSIHGINTQELLDWTIRPGGCLDVAREYQKQGRANFIGFSTHGTTDLIVKTIETGEFDYVNLHWYFVNPWSWPAIEAATKRDMGVFIISPNDKGGKLYAPPAKLVEACQPLSPMIFNDLYCLSRSEVHTLSLGAAVPSDFDEHVRALEHYDRAAETMRPVQERLEGILKQRHGDAWLSRWMEGIPEHTEIPGDLNVREIVRLWTFATALDLVDWAKMRYNLLGQGGHWFGGRNAADWRSLLPEKAWEAAWAARLIPSILDEAHQLLWEAPVKRLSQS